MYLKMISDDLLHQRRGSPGFCDVTLHRWVCAATYFEKSRHCLLLEDKGETLFETSQTTCPVTQALPRRPELLITPTVRTFLYLKLDVDTKRFLGLLCLNYQSWCEERLETEAS